MSSANVARMPSTSLASTAARKSSDVRAKAVLESAPPPPPQPTNPAIRMADNARILEVTEVSSFGIGFFMQWTLTAGDCVTQGIRLSLAHAEEQPRGSLLLDRPHGPDRRRVLDAAHPPGPLR